MKLIAIIEALSPIVMIFGMLMLIVPIVDALYGDATSDWFMIFGLVYIALGFFLYRIIEWKYELIELSLMESLIAYSLAWIIIPCLSAIPLSIELSIPFENALFESISGFTGTGFTVITHLDTLRHGIRLWRGLMQWIGELGVIVFGAVLQP
ncbi:MAG: potassium transporter TrkG [Desulfurococcaceae archaeon]